MKKHHKHVSLKRPEVNQYHRNEWAIYGSTCHDINALVNRITAELSDVAISYIDADHGDHQAETTLHCDEKRYHLPHRVFNSYDEKLIDYRSQIIFINGNHYPAHQQIVIINETKKESLRRRIEQLTNITHVVCESESMIYDFLRPKMTDRTEIIRMVALCESIKRDMNKRIPAVKGLVLAGGKSSRMGTDKSSLIYHDDISQEVYAARLLSEVCHEVYISKSHIFQDDSVQDIPVIKDRFLDFGPLGAILSAFSYDPDAAWLVVACDMPLLDYSILQALLNNRDANQFATAAKGENNDFPEPLLTIYEPRSYRRLLNFLSLGYSCPRKMLINSPVTHVNCDIELITNANTPEERSRILEKIKTSKG